MVYGLFMVLIILENVDNLALNCVANHKIEVSLVIQTRQLLLTAIFEFSYYSMMMGGFHDYRMP